jgi:hypothetical protein
MTFLDKLIWPEKGRGLAFADAILDPVRISFGLCDQIERIDLDHYQITKASHHVALRIACLALSIIIAPLCLIALIYKSLHPAPSAFRKEIKDRVAEWVGTLEKSKLTYEQLSVIQKNWPLIESLNQRKWHAQALLGKHRKRAAHNCSKGHFLIDVYRRKSEFLAKAAWTTRTSLAEVEEFKRIMLAVKDDEDFCIGLLPQTMKASIEQEKQAFATHKERFLLVAQDFITRRVTHLIVLYDEARGHLPLPSDRTFSIRSAAEIEGLLNNLEVETIDPVITTEMDWFLEQKILSSELSQRLLEAKGNFETDKNTLRIEYTAFLNRVKRQVRGLSEDLISHTGILSSFDPNNPQLDLDKVRAALDFTLDETLPLGHLEEDKRKSFLDLKDSFTRAKESVLSAIQALEVSYHTQKEQLNQRVRLFLSRFEERGMDITLYEEWTHSVMPRLKELRRSFFYRYYKSNDHDILELERRLKESLSITILFSDGASHQVHCFELISISRYFHTLLLSGMSESQKVKAQKTVSLSNLTKEEFQALMDISTTGAIADSLDPQTLPQLLLQADYFQCLRARKILKETIVAAITLENWTSILFLGLQTSSTFIQNKCKEWLRNYLLVAQQKVSQSKQSIDEIIREGNDLEKMKTSIPEVERAFQQEQALFGARFLNPLLFWDSPAQRSFNELAQHYNNLIIRHATLLDTCQALLPQLKCITQALLLLQKECFTSFSSLGKDTLHGGAFHLLIKSFSEQLKSSSEEVKIQMRHLAEAMQTTIPMKARFLMIKQKLESMDSKRSELLNLVRDS